MKLLFLRIGLGLFLIVFHSVVQPTTSASGQDSSQQTSVEHSKFSSEIPEANLEHCRQISPEEWKNPILMVTCKGVRLELEGNPSTMISIPIKDLKTELMKLPVSAWPYERVVALTYPGLGGADMYDPNDEIDVWFPKTAKRNMKRCQKMLKRLNVATVEGWPL